MPQFIFEIIRHGEAPTVVDVCTLQDHAAAWCHVESLALQIEDAKGTYIRAKNADGNAVIITGVATARASIAKCIRKGCPLKRGDMRLPGADKAQAQPGDLPEPRRDRARADRR